MNPKNRVMDPKSQVVVEAQDEQEWELSDEELDREALPSQRGMCIRPTHGGPMSRELQPVGYPPGCPGSYWGPYL